MGYGDLVKNAIQKNFMRSIIAFIAIILGAVFIFMAVFCNVPKENVETRNMAVAFVFGVITSVVSYYFGTSQSSTEKNEIIRMAKSRDGADEPTTDKSV